LRWYETEAEPEAWSNPIAKVKPPKLPNAPIQPITIQEVKKMINKCPPDLQGVRDKAILLTLVDTGIRASELLQLNIDDFNQVQGSLLIRHGKGDKTRKVYMGKQTRKLIRVYLSQRTDSADALFVSMDNKARLTYAGLRWIVINRSKQARVKARGIHTFRRLYALTMLRNGVDVITLSRLMGHSDLQVLKRYLAQTDDDLREAHAHASPVDNSM
jgi:site-specific recombinase XerD